MPSDEAVAVGAGPFFAKQSEQVRAPEQARLPVAFVPARTPATAYVPMLAHSTGNVALMGHPGSVVFHCWEEKIAFTGDTLLSMNIGRTDFPGGDREQMAESLEIIAHRLPDDTIIYPGHGKKSTMGHEKACDPYL